MDNLLAVTAEIVDRATGARHQVPADQIALDAPGIVVLTLQPADIDHLERSGPDLVIHLISGETITIAGFYADGVGSELVLQGPDGSLWYWDQSSGGHSLDFLQISDIESLLYDDDNDNGALPILLGLGALGLAGAVALAGEDGDDDPNPPDEDDTTPPSAPTAALADDTGEEGDGRTSDATVNVGGLEPGASWEYSTDGGQTWHPGTGTSFELPPGEYDADDVQVRQTDAAGNTSVPGLLGPVIVDTIPPAAPVETLENDTGTPGDGITTDGTILVSGIEPAATWEYSTDGGQTWLPGTGASFELPPGEYEAGDVQVRQTDEAGNTSAPGLLGPITVDTGIPAAPTAALENDTGTPGDGITSDGTVDVSGLEPGATWEYSTNGGTTWTPGTGTSFDLAPGTYDADDVQVRQTDPAGNTSGVGLLGPVTIDTTGPSTAGASATISPIAGDDVVNASEAALDVPVTVTLAGAPPDAASTVVTVNVGGTDYPATDNGDGTWTAEVPGSVIAANTSVTATAIFTDTAGNASAPLNDTRPYSVDTGVPAAPTPTLENDTGTPGDGITSDGTVDVTGIEPSATWEYSTDGGTSWTPGTGTTFDLAPGTYDADDVQVRQTDPAGNTSAEGLLGPVTVDVSLNAVNDSTTLDMGAISETDYAPQVTSDVQVIGLLESNEGADASAPVTVLADRSGELRIEVSQSALVAVGDAYRLDVIDADGNIVYQGATATSPLVGQVVGLQVLGLTGDNTLTATVTGLPPGTYSVVLHNDSSILTDLLDTDGGGVSVEELGDAGVVVGADNQSLILAAVSNALGPLGPAAVLLLDPVLTGLDGQSVTGILGPLTGILNTVGFLGVVDDVLDAVAAALLSNTLTLLQETTITTTLTEYEFATETITGNVITGDAGLGVDDIGAGGTITQVANADGTIAPVPAGGGVTIAGAYGELTLNSDGSYTYNAYGAPMSVGEADVFTYTLSDGGASDTATLTITLAGEAVVAAADSASASFVWENVQEPVTDSHNLSGALSAQTTDSPTFTLDAATLAEGTVVVSAGLAGVAMSGNAVLQEETSPGVWTNVPGTTDSFSVAIAVLGAELATIDIGALTLDPGNYRVHVTLNGSIVALAITVDTDLTLTHTDQFVLDQATGATGNLLTNDAEGSGATQLQIQNDADLYVGGPVTVQGTYGALTVQADGSYTYVPNPAVAYFDTPQVDSFNYQLVHPNGQVSQAALDVSVEPSGAGVAGFAGFSLMSFGFGDDTIPLGDFPFEPDAFFSIEDPNLNGIVEPTQPDEATSVDTLLDQFLGTQDTVPTPDSTPSVVPDTAPPPEQVEDPLGYLTPVPIDDQHLQHPTVV